MKKLVSIVGVISIILVMVLIPVKRTSIVNYKEYKAGTTTNLVLNKILSDNELKTEVTHMFNYASNGNYYDINSYEELNDSNYVTEGLYSSEDEDGISYYYRGNVDNNIVQFGEYEEDYYVYVNNDYYNRYYYQSEESCIEAGNSNCEPLKLASAGDKMYWKIVRVNGDGSLRLIYNGLSPTVSNIDITSSFLVGYAPYNLDGNDSKYTGYTYDNGTDSFIKKEVDTWYNNTLGSSSYDNLVILGRFCSDSSGYNYDGYGSSASSDRLGQAYFSFAKDNSPTLICPDTSESYGGSYNLKAGLITADELVFAGESLNVTGNSYLNPTVSGMAAVSSYTFWWSMTPSYYNYFSNVFVQNYDWSSLVESEVYLESGVRPVINISTDNMTLTGDGTIDNPYMLEKEDCNNYQGTITIGLNDSSSIENAFDNIEIPSNITWTSNNANISIIKNKEVLGLSEGTTTITGISNDSCDTYEIEVTVISNPVTMSNIYILGGILLILILSTAIYLYYKKKYKDL